MLSYPSLVDGQDVDHEKWLYVIRAGALLRDEIGALKLKRNLDRGVLRDTDDQRVAGRVGFSTTEHVVAAAAAARRAQPDWGAAGVDDRIAFARAVGERVRAHAAQFTEVLVAEGHPKRLAVWEVASSLEMTSQENLDRVRRQLCEVGRVGQRETRLVRKPDGVVAVHPPHNAATANSMLAMGALMAGNSVVIKAPRSAPLGTAWFWREMVRPVLSEMGAPAGVLNVICASPGEVLDHWLNSDDVDDLMFFGESERGIAIGNEWTARGKKAILELAGNDGVLVWRDAEVSHAVTALTECFYGSSQICMVPKYAIVHADVAPALLRELTEAVAAIRPGYPEDEESLLSPVLKQADYDVVLKDALSAGAELVHGGRRLEIDGRADEMGPFIEPTLLRIDGLAAAETLDVVRRETFFPLLPIVVVEPSRQRDDRLLRDCVDFMNRNKYGLRNSVWSRDEHVIDTVCRRLNNGGILKINDSHIGQVAGLPTHGGTGLTGGPFGEAHYPVLRTSHLQAISIATAVEPRTAVFSSVTGRA
ncbi:aldehyde dehydrogenase family protein [Saccharothrix deserti]|uniref:aldehyde dehydrogenase family protein n=1 Tax=Saccharothrix deserti TaxID=2593674 RepID=UPI00131E7A99|nr:aldehyde dehydrogenase family protein [Saccharothrix deserti]